MKRGRPRIHPLKLIEHNPAAALTTERRKQHGDWLHQSTTAQQFKRVIRDSWNYNNQNLSDSQLDAIEMIVVKISRILTGDPRYADHWSDIQGYAELGKNGHLPSHD